MIEDFLKSEKEIIEKELKNYFNDLLESEKELLFEDFFNLLREFIVPEKSKANRFPPILLIAAFSGIVNPIYLEEQIDQIRKVSISVELLYNGHLIYDDLIDEDDLRRGKPSFHVQLKNELTQFYKTLNIPKKDELVKLYRKNMGMLGGTFSHILGLNVLRSAKFPDKLKLLAINEFMEAVDYLIRGQILEEYMEYHNITMSLEQYLNIAEMQRARLFEKSTKIGAILARGNLRYQIRPLSEAMLKIGQAHTIRDDIKDIRKDIEAKKKKFVYIISILNCNEEQSKILNEIYRKPELTKDDVKEVENIFIETNAIEVSEQFSKNLIEQAKGYLKEIYPDLNKEQKQFFNEFSDFIYMRNL